MCEAIRGSLQEWATLRSFYRTEILKILSKSSDYKLEYTFMLTLDRQIEMLKELKEYTRETPASKERDDLVKAVLKQLNKMSRQRRSIRKEILPNIRFPKEIALR